MWRLLLALIYLCSRITLAQSSFFFLLPSQSSPIKLIIKISVAWERLWRIEDFFWALNCVYQTKISGLSLQFKKLILHCPWRKNLSSLALLSYFQAAGWCNIFKIQDDELCGDIGAHQMEECETISMSRKTDKYATFGCEQTPFVWLLIFRGHLMHEEFQWW